MHPSFKHLAYFIAWYRRIGCDISCAHKNLDSPRESRTSDPVGKADVRASVGHHRGCGFHRCGHLRIAVALWFVGRPRWFRGGPGIPQATWSVVLCSYTNQARSGGQYSKAQKYPVDTSQTPHCYQTCGLSHAAQDISRMITNWQDWMTNPPRNNPIHPQRGLFQDFVARVRWYPKMRIPPGIKMSGAMLNNAPGWLLHNSKHIYWSRRWRLFKCYISEDMAGVISSGHIIGIQ